MAAGGAIIILEAAEVYSLATQTAAILAATGLADAIGQALALRENPKGEPSDDRCWTCNYGAALSQGNPRKTITSRIRKRI
jgi:hypothetical protein